MRWVGLVQQLEAGWTSKGSPPPAEGTLQHTAASCHPRRWLSPVPSPLATLRVWG